MLLLSVVDVYQNGKCMDNIIYRCRSLINPRYISKWNFNKKIEKDSIFGKYEFSNSSNYTSILNSFNNSKVKNIYIKII